MEATLLQRNGRLFAIPLLLLVATDLAAAQGPQTPPPGGYANFSPSMAIVIVVLIAAFFLLGFFSIYIRHCCGDGAYQTAPLPNGVAARSRRQRGLDAAVLETFPTMAYADVKEHKAVKGALECAVCLSEFDDDETLRLLPKCSHVFHPDCIDTWLASHVTCPVCRANLVPDPDAPAGDVPLEVVPAMVPQQPQDLTGSVSERRGVVVIDVEETEEERIVREEAAELMRIGSVKRALRSKSGRVPAARLPRSHSTGHSLAAPATAGSSERFTLRLPDHVLREIVAAGKLQRTTSLLAFRAGSTRRVGARAGTGESSMRAGRSIRLGQSGRWPSFLSRTFSAKLPAWGSRSFRRGDADGSSKGGRAVDGAKSVGCDDQACAPGPRV